MSLGVLILHSAHDSWECLVPKIRVVNDAGKRLALVIEPWADVEPMEPNEAVTFEYDEPSEIEVAFRNGQEGFIFVMSKNVKVFAKGEETSYKMPEGSSIE